MIFIRFINSTNRLLSNSCPPSVAHMHRWTWSALVQVKACRLFGNCAIRNKLHWNLIGIQSFSFKNMCLNISQRNFPSGDLLIYLTSRLIWYVWYVMQAKRWWPYLGHKTNSQCNRVYHNTLPPYAASRWLCYLFIAIPTSQGMPTNMIEISHLLLIASTECAQYILCRRILPSAVGALVLSWWLPGLLRRLCQWLSHLNYRYSLSETISFSFSNRSNAAMFLPPDLSIILNMLPSYPSISDLYSQLEYSIGVSQAFQLDAVG